MADFNEEELSLPFRYLPYEIIKEIGECLNLTANHNWADLATELGYKPTSISKHRGKKFSHGDHGLEFIKEFYNENKLAKSMTVEEFIEKLKSIKRHDIIRKMKEIRTELHRPQEAPYLSLPFRDLPYAILKEIGECLNMQDKNWAHLAGTLGYGTPFIMSHGRKPFDSGDHGLEFIKEFYNENELAKSMAVGEFIEKLKSIARDDIIRKIREQTYELDRLQEARLQASYAEPRPVHPDSDINVTPSTGDVHPLYQDPRYNTSTTVSPLLSNRATEPNVEISETRSPEREQLVPLLNAQRVHGVPENNQNELPLVEFSRQPAGVGISRQLNKMLTDQYVFITPYTADNSENKKRVRQLFHCLGKNFINHRIDEKQHDPEIPEKTKKWFGQAKYVLVVITEDYKEGIKTPQVHNNNTSNEYTAEIWKEMKKETESSSASMRFPLSVFYRNQKIRDSRFIPLLMRGAERKDIPGFLRNIPRCYNWPQDYDKLVRFLKKNLR